MKFNARRDIPFAWLACSVVEMAGEIGSLLTEIQQKCGWVRVVFLVGVAASIGLVEVYEWLAWPMLILVQLAMVDLAWRITHD